MKERILTAIVGIPIVLACVFWAGVIPLGILLVIAASLGLLEAARLAKKQLPPVVASVVAITILSSSGFIYVARHSDTPYAAMILAVLHFATVIGAGVALKRSKASIFVALSAFYICLPIVGMIALHQLGRTDPFALTWNFLNPILMLILPIWAGDTAAIFVGKYFGKHALAPNISPKKTIEGSIGNLIAATGASVALGPYLGFSVPVSLTCGFACGILGQIGDLYESWIKRLADTKDSGNLLPGHGGILDRTDSLLFCALPVLILLSYFQSK